MTDQEINKAIAEACGWKEVEPWLNGDRCFELNQSACGYQIGDLPDYCNCLNAMHEAEKMLADEDWIEYHAILRKIFGPIRNVPAWGKWDLHLTARQRAEAFLKTVDKWEE